MLTSNGYSLTYYKNRNQIVIGLPQTSKTLTSTLEPIANRRVDVEDEELAILLAAAKAVFCNGAPTVDVVEVVRCKDCKHYNAGFECLKEGYGIEYPQDWFCSDGERREDDD